MHITAGISMDEEREKQAIRRRSELELFSRLDKRSIAPADARKDCWYLVDSQWLTAWALYAAAGAGEGAEGMSLSQAPAPGPMSSRALLGPDQRTPRAGLLAVTDYRGVPSLAFFCFVELHGRDASPDLPRHEVDIYRPAVRPERLVPIVQAGQTQAKILVDALRPRWVTWERHYSDDEDDEEDLRGPACCCGLSREHLEALIYWAVLCCTRASRKKSGRKHVSYRAYRPLQYREGDSTRGFDEGAAGAKVDADDADEAALTAASSSAKSSEDGSVFEFGRSYSRPVFRIWE